MAEPWTEQKSDQESFGFLSLTGYLTLQDGKDRKERLIFKKQKQRYWFWFDEKDCLLKYYRNQECYRQILHNPAGTIDMNGAKVTPSEVHSDSGMFSNKTFLIFTKSGRAHALTAESNEECHTWIKKLQEKRSEWIKRERDSTRTSKSTHREHLEYTGLVNELKEDQRTGITKSHLRKIFYDHLGSAHYRSQTQIPPLQSYVTSTDPFDDERPRTTTAPQLINQSGLTIPQPIENVDGSIDHTSSIDSLNTPDDEGLSGKLTIQERQFIQLQCELVETRQERDKLQKQLALKQDENERKEKENQLLLNNIQELEETIHKLNSPAKQFQTENDNLKDVIAQLKRSLRSLDGEVELYKTDLQERDKRIRDNSRRQKELERELLFFKAKYVSLMDYSFKIPTPSPAGLLTEDPDPMEENLKMELLQLIKDESSHDSPLVDVSSGKLSLFEDQYGELHDWRNDSNICHFFCRHLYLHYTEAQQEAVSQEWYTYLKNIKKIKDQYWEIPTDLSRSRKRELRNFLRKGIPIHFRPKMWASLIYSLTGKMREIKNSTTKGGNYYQSLLLGHSNFQKQIRLDLYRTIPSNKHFKMEGKGAEKLQRVLIAYSNHNVNVGYCQGMNMIAAVGLLFLDEETAFWYMVAIIEKLMPQNYYTYGLAAAQADQAVMRDLVADKLSSLNEHLELNGIDVTVVTFNWFLTLFIDALPTESMLRVMDCFLLEGRKIFFRLSLAVFKLFERRILSMNDPVTMFQFTKEVVKHIFNVEELFRVAFAELEPFPSRSQLQNRSQPHHERFMGEWREREKMKTSTKPVIQANPGVQAISTITKQKKQLQWECGTACGEDEVWLCCGERQIGKICIVAASDDGFETKSPNLNVGSKILCIKLLLNGIIMIGTLDFSVHAISPTTKKELWSMKMNDSVLDFVSCHDTVLCALADGYIAALPTNGENLPISDPILYRIGNTAVQCMVLTPFDHVWVGCGKAITVLSAATHEPVNPIVMSDKAGKVYKIELGKHGIWITFKTSTLLCLYDVEHMVQLIQVDYSVLLPRDHSEPFSTVDHRITVISPVDDILWIGTGNATVHIFGISSVVRNPDESIQQMLLKTKQFTESLDQSIQITKHNDEGLVGGERGVLTLTSSSPIHHVDKNSTDSHENSPKLKRHAFGKTFRHQLKREISQDFKRDGIYQLHHLTSSRLLPKGQECSRVTILKPIRRRGQQFVVSCVNTSTVIEKAVQLWRCTQENSPNSWSYTSIPECYEVITKDMSQTSNPPPVERGRAYSTILGSQSQLPEPVA